jgi:TolB protein
MKMSRTIISCTVGLAVVAVLFLSIGETAEEPTGNSPEKPVGKVSEKPTEKPAASSDKDQPRKFRYDGSDKPLNPEQAVMFESKFIRNVKQVTNEGKSGEGYFSPDGKRIIYQSIRGKHPFYQIFTRDLATGKEQLVSTGHGRTTCAFFHPTKDKIMFASSHLDPDRDAVVDKELKRLLELRRNPRRRSYTWAFDPFMDIFEANLDGSKPIQLTKAAGYDAEGNYSPDGKQMVFSSFRNGNGDIYVADLSKPIGDPARLKQITNSPGYDGGPFFSPDGKRIIFRGEVRKRQYLQIFVINADGSGEWQLTDNEAVNWAPYWHPDGKHIIYATSVHGHRNFELYLMNVDTSKTTRVTFMWGGDVLPVFSPDGKKLMWTSTRGKDKDGKTISQLFIADWVYQGE